MFTTCIRAAEEEYMAILGKETIQDVLVENELDENDGKITTHTVEIVVEFFAFGY